MAKTEQEKRLERIEQGAAEQLLNDTSLRESLNDAQAKSLMDWGLDIISRAVGQYHALSDVEVDEKINKVVDRLKETMILVNLMVEQFAEADEKQATILYQRFLEALQYLQPVPIPTMQKVEQVVSDRKQMGPGGTFDHLIKIIC